MTDTGTQDRLAAIKAALSKVQATSKFNEMATKHKKENQ